MKPQTNKNLNITSAGRPACCSRRQKIFGVIALLGLFACGLMIGLTLPNGAPRHMKKIGMSASQCDTIANQIVYLAQQSNKSDSEIEELSKINGLRELNQIYTTNCVGHVVPAPKPVEEENKEEGTADKKTCEVIEMMQLKRLLPETATNEDAHEFNISIYENLIENGCPENTQKYQNLIQREMEIIKSLDGDDTDDARSCEVVEDSLSGQFEYLCDRDSAEAQIDCAKLYAQLAERGCPENAEKYKNLAARALEIARGISDDKMSKNDTIEVVETYKRLQMQAAARDVINKVQKITDPAIDFILQLEKIINE